MASTPGFISSTLAHRPTVRNSSSLALTPSKPSMPAQPPRALLGDYTSSIDLIWRPWSTGAQTSESVRECHWTHEAGYRLDLKAKFMARSEIRPNSEDQGTLTDP